MTSVSVAHRLQKLLYTERASTKSFCKPFYKTYILKQTSTHPLPYLIGTSTNLPLSPKTIKVYQTDNTPAMQHNIFRFGRLVYKLDHLGSSRGSFSTGTAPHFFLGCCWNLITKLLTRAWNSLLALFCVIVLAIGDKYKNNFVFYVFWPGGYTAPVPAKIVKDFDMIGISWLTFDF